MARGASRTSEESQHGRYAGEIESITTKVEKKQPNQPKDEVMPTSWEAHSRVRKGIPSSWGSRESSLTNSLKFPSPIVVISHISEDEPTSPPGVGVPTLPDSRCMTEAV